MNNFQTAGRPARRRPKLALVLASIGHWWTQRRDAAIFSRLSDSTLRDIGLERDFFGRLHPRQDAEQAPALQTWTTPPGAAVDHPQPERTNPMTTNLDTVRRFLAGTHSNTLADVNVIDETVAEGITCHGFPGFPNRELAGRESYKAFFHVFQASFSELDFTTVAVYEVAGFVSAHWTCEATFSGEFAGIRPDRRRVHFDGVAVYRMEKGLIAETWLSFPEPMLMAQLPVPAAQAA